MFISNNIHRKFHLSDMLFELDDMLFEFEEKNGNERECIWRLTLLLIMKKKIVSR